MPVDETINISDVIEVIETDPDFKESTTTMFNGGGEISRPSSASLHRTSSSSSSSAHRSAVSQNRRRSAYVKIIEEPASKALRFRYECEGRSAGSIPGASSTPENKTFPAIQVCGYQGRAVVVVSCVTKDKPYRPHPHNLVGREGCKKGVCTLEIPPETMTITFSNLGIQCVKKKDIESALKVREEIKVDPYITGFSHRNQPTSIDLNAVRLCFQVFLEGDTPGKFTVQLNPVVSQPIYDKKAMSDLIIIKLSDCVSYVDGGSKDIILLCEKVAKEDIQVRFYEEKDGKEVWEGYGEFQPSQVHKQTAIWFRTPRYHTLDITEPVRVFIQLKRPSDGVCSEPLPFEFLPLDSETGKRKRQKFDDTTLLRRLEQRIRTNPYLLNVPMDTIKVEPRDKTPSPFNYQVLSPNYQNLSPQYMAPTPTPPLLDTTFTNNSNIPTTILPPIASVMQSPQQLWNIGGDSWNLPQQPQQLQQIQQNDLIMPGPSGLQQQQQQQNVEWNVLDLDTNITNQSELKVISINSSELETHNLSESLTNINLSFSDINVQDQNMSDSLTRLAINTFERIS